MTSHTCPECGQYAQHHPLCPNNDSPVESEDEDDGITLDQDLRVWTDGAMVEIQSEGHA